MLSSFTLIKNYALSNSKHLKKHAENLNPLFDGLQPDLVISKEHHF
jgi:hypothetical protein